MVFHGISIISAPHNMGVDTLFVQLSSLLTEIWPTNEFSVMAALICIQIVRGTFCQLVNIANRFLRIFSNLETLIRFIFPGGAGYPYLPTQLISILYKFQIDISSNNREIKYQNIGWTHTETDRETYRHTDRQGENNTSQPPPGRGN